MQSRLGQPTGMKCPKRSPECSKSIPTQAELQSLDRDSLVEIVLQQQEALNSAVQLSPSSSEPSSSQTTAPERSAPQTILTLPNTAKPAPASSAISLLAFIGALVLHGLVLLLPIATPPSEMEAAAERDELVIPMTELPLRPESTPSPLPELPVADFPPSPAPSPPPPSPPPEPSVVVQPPLEPQPSPDPVPSPEPSPEPSPSPDPQAQEPEELEEPEVPETDPTPVDIAGVPLGAAWQVLEQPLEQGVNDAAWYSGSGGQMREGVLGLVEIPESNFADFFAGYQQQLTDAGFTLRPQGSYQGIPIYRLTAPSIEGSLYITLESLEEEDRILLGIWNRYPW